MSIVVVINPGTERCRDFFNFLSADKHRLSRRWPDNVGLTEMTKAGIDATDYGWYINDLQHARIERIEGPNGEAHDDNHGMFRIAFDQMSEGTPAVLEALTHMSNTRSGNRHLRSAHYLEQNGRLTPVSGKSEPVEFEPDTLEA
ncbi:MAG: hypothetical protein KDI90_10490 [Alphaproteobacteria bacterium]|nr:hypothetical protein [Alphaproteobacteria bacterium]MCB9975648.1 hypothetical protein [Rhodospirillales bacterium]